MMLLPFRTREQSLSKAIRRVLVFLIPVLAGWFFPTGLSAQETDPEFSERSDVASPPIDDDGVRVGPEHTVASPTRYAKRTYIGDQGLVVEFSQFALPPKTGTRSPPPRLSDLIGNPARQRALDRAARPGSWVTPPAAKP